MHFLFITLFPEQIEQGANHSILQRAQKKGLLSISCINPRDFTTDNHRTVDDSPCGGGAGMVLKPEPFVAAIRAARARLPGAPVIALSPCGPVFKQGQAQELAAAGQDLILLCGHYEGFDERIYHYVDRRLSLGDFVVTGGELPALLVLDAVARLLPGVLGRPESAAEESFSANLLEYPQYTRPVVYEGLEVPAVLLGGNHALIRGWRFKEAVKATLRYRPDLLPADFAAGLEKGERKLLQEALAELEEAKEEN